jgi:RNA polymerase sigma factor (sigma-70 family)
MVARRVEIKEVVQPDAADDWELVFAWRGGDARAGDRLADRYFSSLLRFFVNKVRNIDDAGELVSETFLGCTAGLQRVSSRGSFRSYLFAIALNKLRGYYRTQAKRDRELDDFAEICVDASLGRSPSAVVAHAQEVQLLVRALRRLTLAQQIVIELRYCEDLRSRDIAELLGVPRPTVGTHLRRGKQRLETIIEELADNPSLAASTLMGLETWARGVRAAIARE